MIVDCKMIAESIMSELSDRVYKLKSVSFFPTLAVVMVGDVFSSRVYVNNKRKKCEELGIGFKEYVLSNDVSQEELCDLVRKLNLDDSISSVLVQFPLPGCIDKNLVLKEISFEKDVDGFNEKNVYSLYENCSDRFRLLPCTAQAILKILESQNVNLSGKFCVVINRSSIVGKPVAMMLMHNDATVCVCHSKTKNLFDLCKKADIIISGVGQANFVTSDMVKDGAVVIDVGISRNADGKVCGDVDFENVAPKCSYITTVPGGVGLVTVAILMENIVKSAELQSQNRQKL